MNTAVATADQPIIVDELVDESAPRPIATTRIRPSPYNRKRFNEAALHELAESIKVYGILQAIVARPVTPTPESPEEFEIVAGERRYRACIIAGVPEVLVLVRRLSDVDAAKIRILENLQREDPHPIEEAEGFQELMQRHGYDADQVASEVKKSRSYIYGRLKLLALTTKARDLYFDDKISASIALLIARIPVKSLQEKCLKEVSEHWNGPMSYRTAVQHVESHYMVNLKKKAVFKIADETLVPAAGSCMSCPKRTGNQPEVFSDVSADVCTDPICFKTKAEAHVERVKAQAKNSGMQVLAGAEAKKVMPNSWASDLKCGFIAVDRPVYSDEKNRSIRQLLGKSLPTLTLLESPHDGEIIHIAKADEVAPLLEALGHRSPQSDTSSRDREKEQEARAKLEREYRKRLFTANHHASLMMNLVDADLRLVAQQMFENLPWATIPTKFLIETYGWTENMFGHPRRENIRAAIDALTQAQLNQFIRDCALCRDLDVSIYTDYPKSKPENMLAFSKRTKVDAKKIRAEVEAAAAAKKGKKKATTTPTDKVPARTAKPGGQVDVNAQVQAETPAPAEQADLVVQLQAETSAAADQVEASQAILPKFLAIMLPNIKAEDLVEYIRANPEHLNDLTKAILAHPRGELVGMLEKAATQLGYEYRCGQTWALKDAPAAADQVEAQLPAETPAATAQVDVDKLDGKQLADQLADVIAAAPIQAKRSGKASKAKTASTRETAEAA